jgi:hypothetical protein
MAKSFALTCGNVKERGIQFDAQYLLNSSRTLLYN